MCIPCGQAIRQKDWRNLLWAGQPLLCAVFSTMHVKNALQNWWRLLLEKEPEPGYFPARLAEKSVANIRKGKSVLSESAN